MIKFLKDFFKPASIIYSYNSPKEIVVDKINETFKKGSKFFSEVDMSGFFTSNDTFEMSTTSIGSKGGFLFKSTLIGKITKLTDQITQVETKTEPSIIAVTLSFICPIIAIIYFFAAAQSSLKSLLTGALSILTGTLAALIIDLIIIFISGISTAGVIDRYKMYIDRPLQKMNFDF